MVRALKVSARGNLQVLEMAQPLTWPVSPRPVLAGILGGIVVFFLVIFEAFLRGSTAAFPRGSRPIN